VRDLIFHLDRTAGATLQVQLRQMVVSAILKGQLPPGEALPSCRQLADRLGIARNTVMLAYQHLVDEGYLESRERSGYYVCGDVLRGRAAPLTAPAGARPGNGTNGVAADGLHDPGDRSANGWSAVHPGLPETVGAPSTRTGPGSRADRPGPDWTERFQVRPSVQRNIGKRPDWPQHRFPFVTGQTDPSVFPLAAWRDCSRQALALKDVSTWTADHVGADDAMLVEQLRTHVLPRRGVMAEPDEILVTVGAQHALFMIASLLVRGRTVVGIEDPGYADARNIFGIKTPSVRPLPVDAMGLVTDDPERLAGCDYIYLTPSHQNPTTVTLPMARRQALLRTAREHDIVLVEDDYESESNYAGNPTPALKGLDDDGRVIYVGSLSKTIAPGLRLGYMVGPAPLIAELRALRRLMVRHPPANNQRTVALFIANGHYDALVRRLHHVYRSRWEAMGAALEAHLPGAAAAPAYGGTSFWVRGPEGLDSEDLAQAALAEGVVIEPGTVFFAGPETPRHYFRLGFSSIAAERIEPGVRALAGVIARLR